MRNIYFDNAASTKVRGSAVGAMLRVMETVYGNPSSSHTMGRMAAAELAAARDKVAGALGAQSEEIFFTSGGTESGNWAVFGVAEAMAHKGRHIVTTAIEHDAIMEPVKKLISNGWEATLVKPNSNGRIPVEDVAAALREDTVFVSVMLVNNETGAVNPLNEIAGEVRRLSPGAVLHTDAVQGFCKVPFTVKTLGVDLLTVSAHKIHGPKGVGALYIKSGTKLPPLILGGGHESGRRSGTEALPAIAGFGEAAMRGRSELSETSSAVRAIRDHILTRLSTELPQAITIGNGDSPFILSLSLPGYKSEVLMNYLEGEGIFVSKSAACKKGARSRVLEAMKLKNEVIDGTLRVSFSKYSTMEEADFFTETLIKATGAILKSL